MIDTVCEILKISRSAYFKYKKEGRPIISLLEQYCTQEDLEEYLQSKKISKFENHQDLLTLGLLEDSAHFSLNEKIEPLFNIFGIPDITKVIPKKIFKRILIELKYENISHEYAKDSLLQRLKGYETSLSKLEHENHLRILYDFVDKKLSKIEVYILIKHSDNYFK